VEGYNAVTAVDVVGALTIYIVLPVTDTVPVLKLMLQVEYGDGISVFVVKFVATILGAVRLVAVTGKFEL
jgi:hypothetical protein